MATFSKHEGPQKSRKHSGKKYVAPPSEVTYLTPRESDRAMDVTRKRRGKEKVVGDRLPKDKGPKFVLDWPVYEKVKMSSGRQFMDYLSSSVPPVEGLILAK